MSFRVFRKNLDVGAALRERVSERISEPMGKYGGYSGHATLGREGFGFGTECAVHLDSGLHAEGMAADANGSADQAALRLEAAGAATSRAPDGFTPVSLPSRPPRCPPLSVSVAATPLDMAAPRCSGMPPMGESTWSTAARTSISAGSTGKSPYPRCPRRPIDADPGAPYGPPPWSTIGAWPLFSLKVMLVYKA